MELTLKFAMICLETYLKSSNDWMAKRGHKTWKVKTSHSLAKQAKECRVDFQIQGSPVLDTLQICVENM